MRVITCEQVSNGHPDKLCDQIADAIVTDCLKHDRKSRVAAEVLIKNEFIVVAGEITSKWNPNYEMLISEVFERVGPTKLDYEKIRLINLVRKQSGDIAMGVNKGGAGDQGMMYGYATNETPEMLPIPFVLATDFLKRLGEKNDPRLKADAKAQVSFDYDSGKVTTFLCSVQHRKEFEPKDFREDVTKLMKDVCAERGFNTDFEKLVNPTGRFVIGGSFADCGVTGRKLACDTYGGVGRIGGGAMCVDRDTEYLTRSGWKKIADYDGELVGQWNDGKLEFVKPSAYVVNEADGLMRIRSANVLDMVLSPMHDVVLITEKGNVIKKQARYLFDENGVKNGSHGYIPTSFEYDDDSEGLDYSDDEIRLQVAFCADGTLLMNKSKYHGRVRIKKEHKKERMRYLLDATKTEYRETYDGDYSIFWFDPPRYSKGLYECFTGVNARQNRVIAEEVQCWDGSERRFRTTIKDDADFVQVCFMKAYGTNASITVDERIGEKYGDEGQYTRISNCYEVYATNRKTCQIKHGRASCHCDVESYDSVDGKMYCFTVPSGMLVLRRNNRVFVTGNCGKDPTKVDRSGAYIARKIAKDIVVLGYCDKCEVQIAYAIGVPEPVSVYVNTFGTGHASDDMINGYVNSFDLTPRGIIKTLNLLGIDYNKVSAYGHFWNQEMPWEKNG